MLRSINIGSQLLLFHVMSTLDFAQLEKGLFSVSLERFSPKSLLQEVVSLERFNLEGKKIQLLFDIEGIRQVDQLVSDKNRVAQVLLNLIQNAIKFS
jgi:two-component system, NarL family, sensor histidine kinase BarA